MTTPGLVSLRALVEADPAKYIAAMFAKLTEVDKEAFNFCVRQARGPDAWAALGQLAEESVTCMNSEHGGHPTCPHNEQVREDLLARIARLEEALEQLQGHKNSSEYDYIKARSFLKRQER